MSDQTRIMRAFVGWLTADIPELHDVEVPRLADSLDRFLATVPGAAAPPAEATDAQQASSQNPPRRAGHDSEDWIDRAAADIRDLNPDYRDFETEVAVIIRGYVSRASLAPAAASAWQPIETAPKNVSIFIYIPHAEHYGEGIYRAILVDMGTGPHWMTTGLHVGRDCQPYYQPTHWMPLPDPPQAQPSGVVPPTEQKRDAGR